MEPVPEQTDSTQDSEQKGQAAGFLQFLDETAVPPEPKQQIEAPLSKKPVKKPAIKAHCFEVKFLFSVNVAEEMTDFLSLRAVFYIFIGYRTCQETYRNK